MSQDTIKPSEDEGKEPVLFISDLAKDISSDELKKHFGGSGEVTNVVLREDDSKRGAWKFGFIYFKTFELAKEALEKYNQTMFKDRLIRLMWHLKEPKDRSTLKTNLLVKNIHTSISPRIIYECFRSFGDISSFKMSLLEDGHTRGFCFVSFYDENIAQTVLKTLNGFDFEGKTLSCCYFKPRKERLEEMKRNFNNLYIKGLPNEFDQKELLRKFQAFGEVINSIFPKNNEDKFRGYGYVMFRKPEITYQALQELNGKEFEASKLIIERALTRNERNALMTGRKEARRLEMLEKHRDCNLYVSAFPENFSTDELKEVFQKDGSVKSVVIKKSTYTNKTKFYGFVCFENKEDAAKAITSKHIVNGQELFVTIAKSKTDLEAENRNKKAVGSDVPQNKVNQYDYTYGVRMPVNMPPYARMGNQGYHGIPDQSVMLGMDSNRYNFQMLNRPPYNAHQMGSNMVPFSHPMFGGEYSGMPRSIVPPNQFIKQARYQSNTPFPPDEQMNMQNNNARRITPTNINDNQVSANVNIVETTKIDSMKANLAKWYNLANTNNIKDANRVVGIIQQNYDKFTGMSEEQLVEKMKVISDNTQRKVIEQSH